MKCETCGKKATNFDGFCDACKKQERTKSAALVILADEGFVKALPRYERDTIIYFIKKAANLEGERK